MQQYHTISHVKKKINFIVGTVVIALISILTYVVWSMIYFGFRDILEFKFGIADFYMQGLIILGVGLTSLFLIGMFFKKHDFWKSVKDIMKL